jgi:hypothetical protein
LFTCSPEGFYWISQGYFDKEELEILVLRKVAQAASAGFVTSDGFDQFWPGSQQKETPSWAATAVENRDRLIKEFIKR